MKSPNDAFLRSYPCLQATHDCNVEAMVGVNYTTQQSSVTV